MDILYLTVKKKIIARACIMVMRLLTENKIGFVTTLYWCICTKVCIKMYRTAQLKTG